MNNDVYTTFYLVRHGETEWNVKKIIQGQGDSPLTQNGKSQAKSLAQELKDIHFDLVFSSDLLRAKNTAEIIALEKNLAVQTTALLRERRFGKFEGQHRDALKLYNEYFQQLTDAEKFSYKTHDVESDEELATRMLTFLRESAVVYAGKTILAATHHGIMRSLLLHLGVFSYEKFHQQSVSNSGWIKLQTDGVDFFVREMHGVTIH